MALIPGTLPAGTKYPNDPQTLLDTFASYLTSPEVKKNYPTVTVATPASGGTITFNSGGQDETFYLDIGSAITGLTINFPTDANSVIGQTLSVFARSAVNATVTYPIGTEVPAAPTSLSSGIMYSWRKVAANTWAGEVKSASGWGAWSGTATRTAVALNSAGATYTQSELTSVIQALNALITDLRTLGILRS
jgi:hypothetical protein